MRWLSLVVLVVLAACSHTERLPIAAPERINVRAPDRPAVLKAAELAASLVGAPYRYGGAAPDGFDCSGLVWYVYRNLGVAMPRTAAGQRAATTPVGVEELQPGDLVFFQTPADHVGIYVGDGDFVHAPSSGKSVERSRLHSPYFLLGFAGAGRPAG